MDAELAKTQFEIVEAIKAVPAYEKVIREHLEVANQFKNDMINNENHVGA